MNGWGVIIIIVGENMTIKDYLQKFKSIVKCSNIIFRLITSWLLLHLILFFKFKEDYNSISFAQDTPLSMILKIFITIFLVLTILKHILNKDSFDYYFTFISLFISSFFWVQTNKNIFFIVSLFLCFLLLYKYKNNLNFEKIFITNEKSLKISFTLMGIIMFLTIIIVGILRYKTFNAPNFDLGIPAQNFYYLKKIGIPYSTCERNMLISHFAVHISPIYYLALPIYYLFSSPITLQIISGILIASGIIPIYLIAKNHKLSNYTLLLIGMIYTFYAPAICSTFYDFHENIFLTPLLLWMFYFYEKNNKLLLFAMILTILGVKEDAPIYIAIFGIYMMFDNKKSLGFKTLIIAMSYFIFANFLLNTFGEGVMSNRYDNLIYENSGFVGIIKTFLINPGYFLNQLTLSETNNSISKIKYLIQIFLPLGFIPLKSKKWKNYILLLPLLLTIMTTYQYSYIITFHYTCGIVAFIFYLFIINIKDIKNKNYLVICLVGSLLIFANSVQPTMQNNIKDYITNKQDYIKMENLLKEIPQNSSVSADAFILPHLTNRDVLYETYYHENKTDIDYVVLDYTG